MAEDFVELGAEAVNHLTENYYDSVYDRVYPKIAGKRGSRNKQYQDQYSPSEQQAQQDQYNAQQYTQQVDENYSPRNNTGRPRRQRNRLPSPEGDVPENYTTRSSGRKSRRRDSKRSASLDRESQVSERVIRGYERERDDPPAKPETVLGKEELRKLNTKRDRDAALLGAGAAGGAVAGMSYANDGYGGGLSAPAHDRRANSQQPPRTRGYDDDDSDYDERTGRRYRASGRGYGDDYDDRGYDREIIETERYRGPARDFPPRRQSYGNRSGYDQNDDYQVTQYRRTERDADDYKSQRSRSRGRRDRDRDRDRSYSGSRSRSRSREHEGIRGKLDDTFDTSMKGLGVGLAGAIAGGLIGREVGHKHRQRDMIIGALVGGLGANAAENKWRDWKDEKERKVEREEEKWEQRWDGRSRSAMR